MRTRRHDLIVLMSAICLSGPVIAAELTTSEISDLVAGKTFYLETTAASVTGTPGLGLIYYAPDGSALYKTPKGVMWHGTWTIKNNQNCTVWKEVPNGPCSKYDRQGDTITVIDPSTGLVRAKILKTAPGNPEKLAP